MKLQTKEVDEVEVKTKNNVMDFVVLAASSELVLHVEQAFQNVWQAIFPVPTMQKMDSRDLVEEHEQSLRKFLAETVVWI